MMIEAKLMNPSMVGSPTITIPFPIEDYEDVYRRLAGIGIGDVLRRDCRVSEVISGFDAVTALNGQDVNVDELDYLAKRLESFFEPESRQFEGAAAAKGVSDIEGLINLTFCCQKATVIEDFSDLRQIGREHYLNKSGGHAPVREMDALDAEREARELIRNTPGTITPYGVVYDNGMELEQLYKGREFPEYLYEPCVMVLEVTKPSAPDAAGTFLYLPMPKICAERALERGGFSGGAGMCVRPDVAGVPSDIFKWTDMTSETPAALNEAAHAIAGLDDESLAKFCAIAEYAEPGSAKALRCLAQNTDLFDFYPDTSTPEEYGRKVIAESGHFKYDAELDEFYDFGKYGKWRMEQETGGYIGSGYLCYRGFVSIEEIMAGVASERMDIAEPSGIGMTMGGL